MKTISLKALSRLLIAVCLTFTSQFALAEVKAEQELVMQQEVIHINESNLDQLITLKGIGHKKAEAILAYREKMGGFKSIEELVNVKGIGEKVLTDNKSRLSI